MSEMGEVSNRLGKLEEDGAEARTRLTHVEATLAAHSGKLDRIIDVLSVRKDFNPLVILQFIKDSLILLGIIGGFILYMSSNIGTDKDAVTAYRLEEQSKIIGELRESLLQLRLRSWTTTTEK